MSLLSAVPVAWIWAAVILVSLCIGSFLALVIVRLPRMLEARWQAEALGVPDTTTLGLAYPASHCPVCDTPIRAWHNIPLLGYLWLGGRCANCRTRISRLYPAIEAGAAVLAGLALWRYGVSPAGEAALVAGWMLLVLAAIDARTQLLPDVLTLSLLWLGLLASLFGATLTPVTPTQAILGAAAGYGVLWLVFVLYQVITGEQGMGHGDFKLLAAIGAWVGWQALPLVLLIASLGGSIVGVALIASGRTERGTPMPFGPWLAAAGWLVLLAGDTITSAYLTLSGLR